MAIERIVKPNYARLAKDLSGGEGPQSESAPTEKTSSPPTQQHPKPAFVRRALIGRRGGGFVRKW
jgi:hypothetical protein